MNCQRENVHMSKISPLAWHFPFFWTAVISRRAYEKTLTIFQISNFYLINLSWESLKVFLIKNAYCSQFLIIQRITILWNVRPLLPSFFFCWVLLWFEGIKFKLRSFPGLLCSGNLWGEPNLSSLQGYGVIRSQTRYCLDLKCVNLP